MKIMARRGKANVLAKEVARIEVNTPHIQVWFCSNKSENISIHFWTSEEKPLRIKEDDINIDINDGILKVSSDFFDENYATQLFICIPQKKEISTVKVETKTAPITFEEAISIGTIEAKSEESTISFLHDIRCREFKATGNKIEFIVTAYNDIKAELKATEVAFCALELSELNLSMKVTKCFQSKKETIFKEDGYKADVNIQAETVDLYQL